jgi:deoxyribonuclease-4
MLLLGPHVSVSGGLHTAFARAARIGCTAMQIFVKNASQWSARELTADEGPGPVLAHAAYLINLCAADAGVLARSRAGLEDELRRAERLGLTALVVHPGAHLGAGEEQGIAAVAESLNRVHARTRDFQVLTALETTAGQGTTLGWRFEQLRGIIDRVEDAARMAVCLDTCHLFAAGYPVHTAAGWEETLRAFEQTVGLPRLAAVHCNDSRKPFAARRDRHEHIGKGLMGLEGFRALMNDPRLAGVPKILETEKSEDMHEDVENMNVLKSLLSSC